MKDCPTLPELAALIDGEVAESRGRTLRAHAVQCPACAQAIARLQQLTADLRTPRALALGGASAEAFADEVLSRLDAPRGGRRPWMGKTALALGAAAAVLLLAGVESRRLRPVPEWTARGGAGGAEGIRHVLLRFGRVEGTDFEVLQDGATIGPRAVLAADVGHTEHGPLFLLAVLIDAHGERHWIYPSYEVGAAPPVSVSLPSTDVSRVLSTMTRLDDVAPGPARLVGIVLPVAESVQAIEDAPVVDLALDRLARRYPGALLVETHVVVGESR